MDAIFDQGPGPACPARFNMAAYVLGQAEVLPDKIALTIATPGHLETWTYQQLKSAVLGTATGLLDCGLRPGDRLLMRLGNTVEFPICYLAAIAVGILPVPTSAQLGIVEINRIAGFLSPRMLVAAPEITLPENPRVPILELADLQAMRNRPAAEFETGDANRAAYIVFTSGTDGKPRGVVHAHRAVWARRMMWQGWYGLRPDDRLLHAGAFNWTYTLGTGLMDPWAAGATAIVPGEGVRPEMLPEIMAAQRATIFAAAPGIYRQMLRTEFPRLPTLRHGLSAGEKLPGATRTDWRAATGKPVYEAFGMSECSTFISSAPGRQAPPDTVGFAQPGRRVAILSDTGTALINEPGEIGIARSDPGLMLGYLNDDDSSTTFRGDWFLSGDIGSMDAIGAVRYLGRRDDMMNTGGYRVSPIEVETAMRKHPDIIDCAAVEMPVKQGVLVIAAYYTAKAPIDDNTLADHAEKHLARFKQPRLFHHIDALPRGPNGKIRRKLLRSNHDVRN